MCGGAEMEAGEAETDDVTLCPNVRGRKVPNYPAWRYSVLKGALAADLAHLLVAVLAVDVGFEPDALGHGVGETLNSC